MYLYQDLNRRPSIIDGYRTAIVDTLGPTALHIAHNADLHRLLSSFHRDCPKSSRNLPKWNLSVVLNELTKAPFEPMKDTNLKHLTLKNAFLLVLASGKRRRPCVRCGAGPEVLFGSDQRPERVSVPPFHLLQERTYLRHQTRYSLFLVETNHSTLLLTSRPTSA